MRDKHGGKDPEIMDLYHGTSAEFCDQIIYSEEGFDLRMSKEGSWGNAIYFAELSSCSCNPGLGPTQTERRRPERPEDRVVLLIAVYLADLWI
jgi:hypothetical protein